MDFNVHPTKSEIRFKDSNSIRKGLIQSIRKSLGETGQYASSTLADKTFSYFQNQTSGSKLDYSPNYELNTPSSEVSDKPYYKSQSQVLSTLPSLNLNKDSLNTRKDYSKEEISPIYNNTASPSYQHNLYKYNPSTETHINKWDRSSQNAEISKDTNHLFNFEQSFMLGTAKCQLSNSYIIAETKDGMVIIDQHAAHERILYEGMKKDLAKGEIKRQRLLIPEIIDLERIDIIEFFESKKAEFLKLGLNYDKFGDTTLIVTEVPQLLEGSNIQTLILRIASEFLEAEESNLLDKFIEHVIETIACHKAVKANMKLSEIEMNELIRQMEITPNSAQCNHGRPTYVKLKLSDIEKIFCRK